MKRRRHNRSLSAWPKARKRIRYGTKLIGWMGLLKRVGNMRKASRIWRKAPKQLVKGR